MDFHISSFLWWSGERGKLQNHKKGKKGLEFHALLLISLVEGAWAGPASLKIYTFPYILHDFSD